MPIDTCPGCKRDRKQCVCLFGPPPRVGVWLLPLLLCSCATQQPAERVLSAIDRAKQACGVYAVMTDIPRDARVDEACEALLRVEVRP